MLEFRILRTVPALELEPLHFPTKPSGHAGHQSVVEASVFLAKFDIVLDQIWSRVGFGVATQLALKGHGWEEPRTQAKGGSHWCSMQRTSKALLF